MAFKGFALKKIRRPEDRLVSTEARRPRTQGARTERKGARSTDMRIVYAKEIAGACREILMFHVNLEARTWTVGAKMRSVNARL